MARGSDQPSTSVEVVGLRGRDLLLGRQAGPQEHTNEHTAPPPEVKGQKLSSIKVLKTKLMVN